MAKKPRPRANAVPDVSAPKSTRPPAASRREPAALRTAARQMKRKLDAVPDRVDVRDWEYRPTLAPLPDQVVSCSMVPAILDQGQEGACTGFALAAVINYQLAARRLVDAADQSRLVSPRMLYEMARRYDEWPGEGYEGSSARGAMKGWVAHGVCRRLDWKDDMHGHTRLDEAMAKAAQETPGGAYYRVVHRNVRDVHGALAEAGIVYATLMIHTGWDDPQELKQKLSYVYADTMRTIELPVIRRPLKGRADGGHAVALVGYTRDGFIVQNSWGDGWGTNGFALLPYEDWMLHATDCWVAQLGVPVAFDLWRERGGAETTAGIHRASVAVPLSDIRPHVVDIGDKGRLSDSGEYWTTEQDLVRLFETIGEKASGWKKRRILLYLHGGLNDERAVARRIVAFRDVCLENEIYPVHIMWETGFWETLRGRILDVFTNVSERAGADWLRRLRDGLTEAKDRSIELTAARPGTALWNDMKDKARLASAVKGDEALEDGGMTLVARHAEKALAGFSAAARAKWELHVVAHSAGSIFAAHAIKHLLKLKVAFQTMQFLAPAITVKEFRTMVLPFIGKGCPHPTMYLLSDVGERDDDVGPYGKSLLYLVSNAFEGQRETPLLGMERFVSRKSEDPNKDLVDREVAALFEKKVDGAPSLVVAGKGPQTTRPEPAVSRSDTHGGFDNDPATLNAVLYRVLGAPPPRPFELRDLQY